jgi:hypothetical protein
MMPIPEILTSLLVTYASSEYYYGSKWRAIYAAWAAIGMQAFQAMLRLAGYGLFDKWGAVVTFWPIKAVLVSFCFTGGLWLDCSRVRRPNTRHFFEEIGNACLHLLPVFPWVAIFISFGFFILISLLDSLSLPTKFLNGPIYYGTLYGPFSIVYIRVKKAAAEAPLLPHASAPGSRRNSETTRERIRAIWQAKSPLK